MRKQSTSYAIPIAAFLVFVAPSAARANSVCSPASSTNQICNASFEETSQSNSQMPEGWDFAPGWAPPAGSSSTAYLSPDPSQSSESLLKIVKEDDPVLLDSEFLVSVEAGKPYRLAMKYRMDHVGEDPRGRIALQALYLDANQQPILYRACGHDTRISCTTDWDCGDGQTCLANATAREGISSVYNPVADGNWRRAESTVTPGIYLSPDGGPQLETHYVKLRLLANSFFHGEASVEDISLARIHHANLESLPEGAVAYDIAPLICVGGDVEGSSCQNDGDCGSGTCGSASGGFEVLREGVSGSNACGFAAERGSILDTGAYPTTLLGRNISAPEIECRLEGSSDYVVSLYMGGYWRLDPRHEMHHVTINDAPVPDLDETQVCVDAGALNGTACTSQDDCGSGECRMRDVYNDLYFERVTQSLVDPTLVDGRGYAIYDEYIWPSRYRRHDLPVQTQGDGSLRISVARGSVGAIVITPGTPETADLSKLDTYDSAMREEFVSRWANFVDPEETGLPIVQGSYKPLSADDDRGYVLFRRHWMEFVEFSSRPEAQDVIYDPSRSELAIQATPGEYEPLTFSLWPLRPLEGVTLEVSDLRSSTGDAIPAESVSTFYVQSRPQRLDPPTSFSYLSGFLPDWEERDLHVDLSQRAWLNVHVPEGTPTGIYSGTVTVAASNAPPVEISLEVEVLPFELVRPERTHLMHLGPGNGIIMPVDKDAHRHAASQHLKSLGFRSEIGLWWPSLFRNGGAAFTRDENGVVEINWDAHVNAGTPDQQVAEMRASNDHTSVWVDSTSMVHLGILEGFGAEGSTGWTVSDTEAWLRAVEKRFGPEGYGFEEILLHVTAEENHYEDADGTKGDTWYAWLDFLAYVADHRSEANWPRVRTVHSFNTSDGQARALAEAKVDLPALGIFHGVRTTPREQIADATATENPFLLYGLRGRLVPGFFLWKSGASGTYHEWYSHYDGAVNDDWDNRATYYSDGSATGLLNEGPGWANAHYSAAGKMVGSWMTEELREGIDDDAYMTTLEHWIDTTASDSRSQVVYARKEALAALETIHSRIDLDAVVAGLTDGEAETEPMHFGRAGLNLVRTLEGGPAGFDALRQIAIGAIRGLVAADASASDGSSSGEMDNSSPWSGNEANLRSGGTGIPPVDDGSSSYEDAENGSAGGSDEDPLAVPEPGAALLAAVALLALAALSHRSRAPVRTRKNA